MNSASLFVRLNHARAAAEELSFPKLLILVFTLAFLVHGLIGVIFINQPIALDDMFQYDMLARSLKAGNGFRWYAKPDVEILRPYYSQFLNLDPLSFPDHGLVTTFRAPGYPLFLALLYLLIPEAGRFALARLAQAGLAAILASLSVALGTQAGLSRKECLLATLGITLYPILLIYPIGLASENLYIPLGLATLILTYRSTRNRSWGWIILAGIAGGMTMLTRSIFGLSSLLAGGWIAKNHPNRKKAGEVFLLVAFGVCLPWSIRNTSIMHQPAFVESSAGYNLFIGYHPQGDGGFVSQIAILPMSILDDGERDRACLQQAIQFILQNPAEASRRVWARLVKFIGPEDREFFCFYSNNYLGAIPQPWITLVYSLLVIPWGTTLFFGIIGLWQKRADRLAQLVVLFLLGYCVPHLFIISEPRFHLAWVPILIPYSVFGLRSLGRSRIRNFLTRDNLPGIFILILVAVTLITGFSMNFPKLHSILSAGGNQLHFSY